MSLAPARSSSSPTPRPLLPHLHLLPLSVVASLRHIDPKVLAKATSTLLQGEAAKNRKGVWIEIDDEDESERGSAVASEGSTITGTASVGSTVMSLKGGVQSLKQKLLKFVPLSVIGRPGEVN